jgi:prepilin-type N-terminal cleavage/methylation domain-containing protein
MKFKEYKVEKNRILGFKGARGQVKTLQYEHLNPRILEPLNPRGMTLIEVIAVMIIIGILAVIVIPRFDFGTSSKASVDGAAYMVASDIRYAQEFAMANRVSKQVIFTINSSTYSFSPTSSLDPSGRLPSGVTISNNFTITFNSLGEPITTTPSGIWSVTVSAGGLYPRTITVVNYTGKVNI